MPILCIEHPHACLRQLVFNRPDKGNALNTALIQDIQQALEDADQDPLIKAVLITGSGKHFCTGIDTQAVKNGSFQAEAFAKLLWTLSNLSKPTLALAQGSVIGGGVGLIACTDLSFADEQTRFSLPEVSLGWVPAMISPYLVQAVGYRRSQAWALKSNALSSQTALEWGLIDGYTSDYQACLEQIKQYSDTALKAVKTQWQSLKPCFLNPTLIQKTARVFQTLTETI